MKLTDRELVLVRNWFNYARGAYNLDGQDAVLMHRIDEHLYPTADDPPKAPNTLHGIVAVTLREVAIQIGNAIIGEASGGRSFHEEISGLRQGLIDRAAELDGG